MARRCKMFVAGREDERRVLRFSHNNSDFSQKASPQQNININTNH